MRTHNRCGVLVWLSLPAAMAVTLVACGGDDGSQGHSHEGETDVQFVITASDDLSFDVSELRVRAGQRVMVTLRNPGGTLPHNFTIPEIDVENVHIVQADESLGHDHGSQFALHLMVERDGTATFLFTPREPGSYEFFCNVPGHREAGMNGKLIVE